jgi:hypothetical protein
MHALKIACKNEEYLFLVLSELYSQLPNIFVTVLGWVKPVAKYTILIDLA